MMNKYYSLATGGRETDIHIFGEIVSWELLESDVSSYTLSKEIHGLDVEVINVYINSYGGEIAEALAICNELELHKAKIKTYCMGFACSCAADVFMAGDERIMYNASLLMVHNGWCLAIGNANELRKAADDIEKITQITNRLYEGKIKITTEELQKLLDEESWLTPQEALNGGFATSIIGDPASSKASQSAKKALYSLVSEHRKPIQKVPAAVEPPALVAIVNPPDPEPQENKTLKYLSALMR